MGDVGIQRALRLYAAKTQLGYALGRSASELGVRVISDVDQRNSDEAA